MERKSEQFSRLLIKEKQPSRRPRKQDTQELVEVTFINEEEPQEEVIEERVVDELTVDSRIERLMTTIRGENDTGDQIVFVQDGEHIQVIETEEEAPLEEEYLTEDPVEENKDVQHEEVFIKQEVEDEEEEKNTEVKQIKQEYPTYLTLKDISRDYQTNKPKILRVPILKRKVVTNSIPQSSNENTVFYAEPINKKTVYSTVEYEENEEEEMDGKEILRAEYEKLLVETELCKHERTKTSLELSKLELENTKLCMEFDLMQERKKLLAVKLMYLKSEYKNVGLQNEKIRLQLSKLNNQMSNN